VQYVATLAGVDPDIRTEEAVEEVVVDDRLIVPVGPGEALSASSVSPVSRGPGTRGCAADA
jgi:hypothetical protein